MASIPYTLNSRVTIEYRVVVQNSEYGTEGITWTILASRISANIQEVLPSKSETLKQGLKLNSDQIRIRLRKRTDITSDMRVTVHRTSDSVYQIIGGPAMLDSGRMIELVCEKHTTTGQP